MNDMEKAMRALQTYMEQHADEITDEKSQQAVIDRFMQEYNSSLPQRKKAAPESAEDYLELAQSASSEKKSLEYLKKATELDPNNLDVQVQVIFATQMKKPHECQKTIEDLIAKATKRLEKEGYFEEAGEFWTILETRPYMRTRFAYFNLLISRGMVRCAIKEGNELLRLCENDNLGVRHLMMSLYAFLEDEEHALALHEKYGNCDEPHMLFPLAVMFYKLNQPEKAIDYLKRLVKANKDTKKFLTDLANQDKDILLNESTSDGYIVGSYEELQDCFENSVLLFASVPGFAAWAVENLPKRTTKPKKK